MVAGECVHTPPIPNIPDLHGVVEGASDNAVPDSIEVQAHNFGSMAKKGMEALSMLYVP